MPDQLQHPTVDELAAFSAGMVGDEALACIQTHVADCAACRAVLKSLPPDNLVLLLRASTARLTGSGPAAASVRPDDLPPALHDHPRYQVVDKLGQGGMGVVYRAEHRLMRRPVALKVIHPRLLARPAAVARFRREVEAVAQLLHPNIAAAYDAEQVGDTHFLVTELVEGTTLAQLVRERGPLPVAQACAYVRQAALGLQHAHQRGLLHRDIKPHNLMLTPEGTIKLLDFGLATLLHTAARDAAADRGETPLPADCLTDFGQAIGTRGFVAPEQLRDAHAVDARADVYSLGSTLQYLLVGRLLDHTTASSLSRLRPDAPHELWSVLVRMLAQDPAQRYATATQTAEALWPFATTPAATQPRQKRWPAALLAIALIAFFGWYGFTSLRTSPGPSVQATDETGPTTSKPLKEIRCLKGHSDGVRGVAITPDGKTAITASYDKTLRLWDLESGKELRRFDGHTDKVICVALSPDGKRAVSGGSDTTLRVWDVRSGKELRCYTAHTDMVHGVAFAPDGRYVASAGFDNLIRLWDVDSPKSEPTLVFKGHTEGVHSVAFSPDGRVLLSASKDRTVRLWDRESGREVDRFQHRLDSVLCATFSPDGKRILAGDNRGQLLLWDTESRKELHRLQGNALRVVSVAFTPDGSRALSAGGHHRFKREDCTVRVWDAESGQELYSAVGHQDAVNGVAVTPDSSLAVSVSEDTTVRLWQLSH